MSRKWNILSCCHWSHGLRLKQLLGSVAVPPIPVRVPSQRPLAPSVASVMIRVIMAWSWGLLTDLAFALQLRRTSVRRLTDEGAVLPVIASNWVLFDVRSVLYEHMGLKICMCLAVNFYYCTSVGYILKIQLQISSRIFSLWTLKSRFLWKIFHIIIGFVNVIN